jgi:hypothetical protein
MRDKNEKNRFVTVHAALCACATKMGKTALYLYTDAEVIFLIFLNLFIFKQYYCVT